LTDLTTLKLYATRPHACSYLPGEDATTVFIDPTATIDAAVYSDLSRYGFRRSGSHVYRPHCETCHACIPIRLLTQEFKPNRAQKRCQKTNSDLIITFVDSIDTDEHYSVYERYINDRHSDGDMFPPSRGQYTDFLTAEWGATRYIEMRSAEGELLAVAVTDFLDHGLSAVYSFFSPQAAKRSLGSFAVLHQIQLAQEKKLPYLYLGYWIRKCQKMSYKTLFQPYQVMVGQNWVTVTDKPPETASKMQLL